MTFLKIVIYTYLDISNTFDLNTKEGKSLSLVFTEKTINYSFQIYLGNVRGVKKQARNGDDFYGFLGLPFALPPIGDFRWQPPQAPPKWEGTLDATKQPNACAQDGIYKVSPVSYELLEFNLI